MNLGPAAAQGLVQLRSELPAGARGELVFEDLLSGERYPWNRDALDWGLYVKLDKGAAHIFAIDTR